MGAFDSINCCQEYYPTKRDLLFTEAMIGYRDVVHRMFHNAVQDNVFGRTNNIDKLGMLNFLMVYLDLIQWQKEDDAEILGAERTNSYYTERYKTECIMRKMRCLGIDVKAMLTTYELYPFGDALEDGIGYMVVEGITVPINRIRE